MKIKNIKNAKKTSFAKLFAETEKLLIKQYRMWQYGQHSTETLI